MVVFRLLHRGRRGSCVYRVEIMLIAVVVARGSVCAYNDMHTKHPNKSRWNMDINFLSNIYAIVHNRAARFTFTLLIQYSFLKVIWARNFPKSFIFIFSSQCIPSLFYAPTERFLEPSRVIYLRQLNSLIRTRLVVLFVISLPITVINFYSCHVLMSQLKSA